MTPEILLKDSQWISGLAPLFQITHTFERISEYVEGRRRMPPDSPIPGLWRNSMTPYLVEIMDAMGPRSLIQHVVCMCSAQVGKTAAAANVCGYWMDEKPAAILWISGTQTLCQKWAEHDLDPMIDSLGFRYKLGAGQNSRHKGDKTYSKDYVGGRLDIGSAQAPGDLASMSKRILIRDEIDRAPTELTSGEGNWLDVSEARTKAFRDRAKIFDCSTPTDYYESEIFRLYTLGDCRKYMVPCPHPECQKEQELEFEGEDETTHRKWGLKPILDAMGELADVVYICRHCGGEIHEYHRKEMLARGHWQPTKKSSDPTMVSYHISALYSPYEMYSWIKLYRHWMEAQNDPDRMKVFMNTELGLPYKDPGARPDLKIVMSHSGEYMPGDIPAGVVFLTIGMDVQVGKQRYDHPDDGPRLEMEVLGHGEGYRTWQILYRKFYGPVDNPDLGAWSDFLKWCGDADDAIHKTVGANFRRKDGVIFPVSRIFIDSGDITDVVYRFCSRDPLLTACKGDKWTTEEKLKEKGDIAGPSNMMHYRKSRITSGQQDLVLVVSNYYKDALYGRLKVEKRPSPPQPGGYCSFPERIFPQLKDKAGAEADKEYYEQLNAEERRRDGSFHKVRNRNEALDVRVYAMAAGEYHVMERLKELKEAAMRDRIRPDFVAEMTPSWLIARWAQQISVGVARP